MPPTSKRHKMPRQALCGHLFFTEVSNAMKTANKRQLQAEDCPEPPVNDAAAVQYEAMSAFWKEEVLRAAQDKARHDAMPDGDPAKKKLAKTTKPSLKAAVWQMAKRPFYWTAALHGAPLLCGARRLYRPRVLTTSIDACLRPRPLSAACGARCKRPRGFRLSGGLGTRRRPCSCSSWSRGARTRRRSSATSTCWTAPPTCR